MIIRIDYELSNFYTWFAEVDLASRIMYAKGGGWTSALKYSAEATGEALKSVKNSFSIQTPL